MALLLTWVRYTVLFQAQALVKVSPRPRDNTIAIASLTSKENIEATVASFESPSDQASAKRLLSSVKAEYISDTELVLVRAAGSAWLDSREPCTQALDALCKKSKLANLKVIQTAVVLNDRREVNLVFAGGTILILCFVLYGETVFAVVRSVFLRAWNSAKRRLRVEMRSGDFARNESWSDG